VVQQLDTYACGVHQGQFESMWAEAQRSKKPLPRHRASLICSMISLVDLMAPKAHPVTQLKRKASIDHKHQRDNARLLYESFYHLQEDEEEHDKDVSGSWQHGQEPLMQGSLLQLEAETLYCLYSSAAGFIKRSWQGLGRAIRLAKSIGIFEDRTWGTEVWEDDLRRRIAWDLIQLDR
jgi:hypothetical protein